MSKPSNMRVLIWSAATSVAVNLFLISSAFVGGTNSIYVKAADAVAGPPGILQNHLIGPPMEHSQSAFALTAFSSLVCSIVFYFVVPYLLLQAFVQLSYFASRRRLK